MKKMAGNFGQQVVFKEGYFRTPFNKVQVKTCLKILKMYESTDLEFR